MTIRMAASSEYAADRTPPRPVAHPVHATRHSPATPTNPNLPTNAFAHVAIPLRIAVNSFFRQLSATPEAPGYSDRETLEHAKRVVGLATRFANHLGLDASSKRALQWGAYLHDIGKEALPCGVLAKRSGLTLQEFAVVQRHPELGAERCAALAIPAGAMDVVRHHHERWEGGGYPYRLQGEDIPFLARVFSLVDVYDALTVRRAYKLAWTHEEALEEIARCAGTQFDPFLAREFTRMLNDDASA